MQVSKDAVAGSSLVASVTQPGGAESVARMRATSAGVRAQGACRIARIGIDARSVGAVMTIGIVTLLCAATTGSMRSM